MYRSLLVPLLLLGALEARENPFFPAEGMKDMPVTASDIQQFDPLKRAAISLPDSARVLKEVTVKYQNLDGSIGSKSITLDHSVDWHIPLFVSQSYTATKSNIEPVPEPKKTTKKSEFKKLADFGEASFHQSANTLKIVTGDQLLRNFMLVNPHRIVLDFQRDADFRSKTQLIKDGKPYKKIRLGNHKGYYRAVIELDGQYRHEIDVREGELYIRCF